MKFILHLTTPEDSILATRAARSAWEKKWSPGYSGLVEYENGHIFDVHRNKESISVWRIPPLDHTIDTEG